MKEIQKEINLPQGKAAITSKSIITAVVAFAGWALAYFELLPPEAIKKLTELDWNSPTVPVMAALMIILRVVSWEKITGIFKKK